MITLRRSDERDHLLNEKQEAWLAFNPQGRTNPFGVGFVPFEILDEYRLSPGASIRHHPHYDAEIITYVCQGALAYKSSKGRSHVLYAGEFQCETVGPGMGLRQTNNSRTTWAHVFQVWLQPAGAKTQMNQPQKRFSAAERRGVLCVIASPDARRDSLRIHQDVLVYSSLLDPGQHVVHPFLQGRSGWLHLVEGEMQLGDDVLTTGDGAGIKAELSLSFTACEKTEILLLDIGDESPLIKCSK